jgi:hypothetical protein
MALSDAKIRAAKPRATILKLSDGNGLQLWITPASGKHWKLAYRHGQPSKQKVLPLGLFRPLASPTQGAQLKPRAQC